jgi:hypothetical protein
MNEPTDDPRNPDDDDAAPVRRGSLLTLAGIFLAVVALVWAGGLLRRDDVAAPEGAPVPLAAAPHDAGAPAAEPPAPSEAPAMTPPPLAAPPAPQRGARSTPAVPVRAKVPRAEPSAPAPPQEPALPTAAFTGDRAETERFLAFDDAITLTPEQEAVRVAALTPLAAPCCKQFSAATCCCKCNMARARAGLAKHLIAVEGAGEETVRTAVTAWHHAINPGGWSGDSCFTGGCGRPFHANGCGGMAKGQLVF